MTDLRDTSGRLQRLVLALVAGVACGLAAYAIANALVDPGSEPEAAHVVRRQMSAGAFVLWIGLLAGVIAFVATLAVLTRVAKRRWRERQVPKATARKSSS
jgi:H+/Cl- antiporter ClcA